ncbi:MAG: hypothetical protein R3321_11030, partial [Nitrososphaeraceae archaeon]|nr:hypothetical protein [Nitrososphaeraceae archaeon]
MHNQKEIHLLNHKYKRLNASKKFRYLLIHAPSLAIGAGIASAVIVTIFFGVNGMSSESELVLEPTPVIEEVGPPKITIKTFLDNGSPILGNPNAPITLVEF